MLSVQKAAAGIPPSRNFHSTRLEAFPPMIRLVQGLRYGRTRPACTVQVGMAVGSVGLSAAILLSSVQAAHAVTPEQLLFLEVSLLHSLQRLYKHLVESLLCTNTPQSSASNAHHLAGEESRDP